MIEMATENSRRARQDHVAGEVARVPMTRVRALLLALIAEYQVHGYVHSQVELQKLMYFIQQGGDELSCLTFTKGKFGPYSRVLLQALAKLDGVYLEGAMDGTRRTEIKPIGKALEAAKAFLEGDAGAQEIFDRVTALIQGFETPYGLELLATVHYAATFEGVRTVDEATTDVKQWSSWKSDLPKARHIEKAWERLGSQGWLPA